jgi:putative hydrolase of the HAD superfamily
MKDLKNIKYWLFDLDNTLYSGDTKVFDQVDKKMSKFISDKLNVGIEEAKEIQKNYFHKIDANEFLEFVHDVDLNFLQKNKPLEKEIAKLNGKKIIFTNGSKAHAANVTKRIGIEKLFDGVFDIVDSDFVPKPSKQPYEKVIENFKIEPQYCIFFEDIARNLKPAHELGMKTVWIENDEPWAAKYSDSEFINYKTKNLANFLKEINEFRQI